MTTELDRQPTDRDAQRVGARALEGRVLARPGATTARGLAMPGIDYLRAMVDGVLPPPPISGLMEFTMVSADPGRVVFTCRPDESAYNPIGVVHGGLICTLLDSVAGCALHSTLPRGKGYTSIEIKVNYLKAVRLPAACSPPPARWSRPARASASPRASSPTPRAPSSRPPRAPCWCSTSDTRGLTARYFPAVTQRILVVGAGIAGLATAVALQRRGHRVAIVEERTDTSSGAGISIWPNALAALDEIGLGDAVRDSGGRVSAGAMRWPDGPWLRHPSPERIVNALGEPLVVVRRSVLMGLLAAALTAGTIESGLAATELVVTAPGVRITLSDGTIREADAVVGADGVGSTVARHLNGSLRAATWDTRRGAASPRSPSTRTSPARPWAPAPNSATYRSVPTTPTGSAPSAARRARSAPGANSPICGRSTAIGPTRFPHCSRRPTG